MDLSVKFVPGAGNGMLQVADAQVFVQLEPAGTASEVIDYLGDVTNNAEGRIGTGMRVKLLEPQTRTDMAELFTRAMRQKFPEMCSIVTAQMSTADDLMLRYTTPFRPGMLCPNDVVVYYPGP